MSGPLDWSLMDGAVPLVLLGGAAVAGVLLLAERSSAWWRWKVPLAAGLGLVAGILTGVVVDDWWRPFPDELPTRVLVWIGLVITLTAASQINRHYQYYPSFGRRWGRGSGTPPILPAGGTVSEVTIPATALRFSARGAWVYLPPSSQASPRPQLPLMVLIAGQAGSPRDWIDSLGLKQIMDGYASAYEGLAPVVMVPDVLGSQFANPLCLDSRLGKVQTYLTTYLPAGVRP